MNTFLQSLDLDHVRRFGEAISLIGRVIGTEVQGFGRGGIVGLITEPVAGLEEFFGLVQDTGTKAVTDYTIAVSHLNTWLATGDITQQQYTEGIAKAAAAYSKATDSVKHYGMALDQAERHPGGVGATSTGTGLVLVGWGFLVLVRKTLPTLRPRLLRSIRTSIGPSPRKPRTPPTTSTSCIGTPTKQSPRRQRRTPLRLPRLTPTLQTDSGCGVSRDSQERPGGSSGSPRTAAQG
jgi:hypothetical protein